VQVSLSAFAFLFSELVQYNQTRVDNIAELERRSPCSLLFHFHFTFLLSNDYFHRMCIVSLDFSILLSNEACVFVMCLQI
jgi:hypothetical protein